jgi:hypothetical protein
MMPKWIHDPANHPTMLRGNGQHDFRASSNGLLE